MEADLLEFLIGKNLNLKRGEDVALNFWVEY
jgi:hypothetical protein